MSASPSCFMYGLASIPEPLFAICSFCIFLLDLEIRRHSFCSICADSYRRRSFLRRVQASSDGDAIGSLGKSDQLLQPEESGRATVEVSYNLVQAAMAALQTALPKIIPARLSFLAIYNPVLGPTEETFDQQVVLWYSRAVKARRKDDQDPKSLDDSAQARADENEKLRQVGLAQGIVDFAKSFAGGQPADHVDTEKSRVVIKELENDWWILASIELTQIPASALPAAAGETAQAAANIEYSAREVSPPALLTAQLIQAHRIFLLHNGPSLSELYVRLSRLKFCGLLERFWLRYAQSWDVLLHGNPAVDIYSGLKLAAGGELGIGVGEEDWGSGEREVLEDFAGRTEGLVDLVVARYGAPSPEQTGARSESKTESKAKLKRPPELHSQLWMGAGNQAQAEDGVVFSGVGAISRPSLRDVSKWMGDVYSYGDYAYGVKENPSSDRRKRKRKQPRGTSNGSLDSTSTGNKLGSTGQKTSSTSRRPPGIPPPIVSAAERSLQKATAAADSRQGPPRRTQSSNHDQETWKKYLTLGYGTVWGSSSHEDANEASDAVSAPKGNSGDGPARKEQLMRLDPEPDIDRLEEKLRFQIHQENNGHFIIGLKGDISNESAEDDNPDDRILLRTLYVEVKQMPRERSSDRDESNWEADSEPPSDGPTPLAYPKNASSGVIARETKLRLTRLRVVVYVHRPFIYVFFFQPRIESLSLSSFYRNLHAYLSPLHKPLSASTNPSRVAARIAAAGLPYYPPHDDVDSASKAGSTAKPAADEQPIYDLVYDPLTLNIHASIPNIPLPTTQPADERSAPQAEPHRYPVGWTRADALNVHSTILELACSVRNPPHRDETECSVKTGRGWWVVWMRLVRPNPDSAEDDKNKAVAATAAATAVVPPDRTSTRSPPTAARSGGDQSYFPSPSPSPSPASTITALRAPSSSSSSSSSSPTAPAPKEALLVRRARDALPADQTRATTSSGGGWPLMTAFGLSTAGPGAAAGKDAVSGWGPARLAEGVGVDARKYVEGLVGLGR